MLELANEGIGGAWILKFDIFLSDVYQKGCSFIFEWVKWNFTTVGPPGKNPFCLPQKKSAIGPSLHESFYYGVVPMTRVKPICCCISSNNIFKRKFSVFSEIRNPGRWGWRTTERRTEAANSHSSRYRSRPENSFVGWSDVGSWHWKRVYCASSAWKSRCW